MQALIYGKDYRCYLGDEYIGTATYTNDSYIGNSFILLMVHKSRGIQEIALMPDNWNLITE